jgi:hemolysin activation/secretion protein
MKPNAYAVCCVLALSSAATWANGFSPDAGNMMANNQDMFASRASAPVEGFPLEYYPKLRWTDDFSIQVERITIEGNSLVAPQRLEVAVKDFVGKRLMVSKLSAVSAAVAKAYKDSGYRVKAYIPEQSFARGRLVVQVIEADPISR